MKKVMNIILGFVFMGAFTIVELYPTIKIGAKIYVKQLDFKDRLNSEPILGYISFLEAEEKKALTSFLEELVRSKAKN